MNKSTYLTLVDKELENVKTIIKAKNNDYTAGDASAFANFESTPDLASPFSGVLIRMGDKMQRLRTYAAKGKLEVVNEGADDAARDVIGYALILLGMLADAKAKDQQSGVRTRTSDVTEDLEKVARWRGDKPPFQIKAGHSYRTREGESRYNMQPCTRNKDCFVAQSGTGNFGTTHRMDGHWAQSIGDAEHRIDLVEEIEELSPSVKVVDAEHDHS